MSESFKKNPDLNPCHGSGEVRGQQMEFLFYYIDDDDDINSKLKQNQFKK